MATTITKKAVLNAIIALVEADAKVTVEGVDVTGQDVLDYAYKTIEQLEAKADKAKERAAEKKATGDALRAAVEATLTDEYQTGEEITSLIDDPEVTKSKVVVRLTALIKEGKAHKTFKKDGARKVTVYAAGPAPQEEVTE